MKIVVSGGWSYGNIGDEAIAAATIHLIRRYFPGASVKYTAYDPEDFYQNHGIHAAPSLHARLEKESPAELERMLATLDDPALAEYRSMMDADTVFIMSGGGYFHQNWLPQFYTRLLEIEVAKKCGARVALIGQSIGPVFSGKGRQLLRQTLNLCDYLCVRDVSTTELLGSLDLSVPVAYAPDLAMVICDAIGPAQKPAQRIISIMPAAYSAYVSNQRKKPKNKWVEKVKKHLLPAGRNYPRQLRKLLRGLLEDEKVKIRFVLSTTWAWDRKLAEALAAELPAHRCEIRFCKTCRELCDSLSGGSLTISTKMHPLIISASYGIGTIGISYNYKVDDFMALINSEDSCFHIDKVRAEDILARVKTRQGSTLDPSKYQQAVYDSFAALARSVGAEA